MRSGASGDCDDVLDSLTNASAMARAIARPMPRDAPVITTRDFDMNTIATTVKVVLFEGQRGE